MFSTSNLDTAVQQVILNRRERLLTVVTAIVLSVMTGIVGLETNWPSVLATFILINCISEWADRRFQQKPDNLRLFLCLLCCACEAVIAAWACWIDIATDTAFGLFLALTILWMWTFHFSNLRSQDMRFLTATVVPVFLGFIVAIQQIRPEMIPPAQIWPMLGGVLFSLVFALYSGWVSHGIKSELSTAYARVTSATAAKEQFFAMISHEIRTPLNGVMGIGQLLEIEAKTELAQERASMILTSGSAMKSLLDDLLDHAKLEAGQFEIKPVPMDLFGVLQTVRGLFADAASAKGLNLILNYPPGFPERILGDPIRLQQIVSNLVSNAIKHTTTGEVRIEAAPTRSNGQECVKLSIIDTGPGIPQEAVDKIFMPYQQLDDAAAAAGTGLGLAIARDLTQLMGGTIDVQSDNGTGATFSIWLPLLEATDTPSASTGALVKGRREDEPSLAGLRVLIVDDARLNRLIASSFLEMADIETVEACDGEEALAKLKTEPVDLVVTDLNMPNMGGEELLTEIRSDAATSSLPVVCLSANYRPSLAGFDGQLTKPLDRNALYKAIRMALSR